MTRQRRKPARRGVLLLVVLGLLALFTLLAITFAIVASNYNKLAESSQRMSLDAAADPGDDVDLAAYQVLRGSTSSVLGPISLLEDLYGGDTLSGTIQTATPAVNDNWGQFIAIDSGGLSDADAIRRIGCVLTVTNSGVPAGGSSTPINQSTRIVGYDPTPGRFYLMAFAGQSLVGNAVYVNGVPLAKASYIINGIPFSGGGFGVWTDGTFTANDNDGMNYALRPNVTAPTWNGNLLDFWTYLGNVPDAANEDYDAPDYQNMLLAMCVGIDTNNNGLPDQFLVPVPSAHRPELARYWFTQLVSDPSKVPGFKGTGFTSWPPAWTDVDKWRAVLQPWGYDGIAGTADDNAPSVAAGNQIVAFKRKFMLRPLSEDHPSFNGTNAFSWPNYRDTTLYPDATALSTKFWELNGPWDVDNDGDGIPDSIWVDLGLPIRTDRLGRQYKPLYAILCLDLDGRLNLNTCGSTAQLNNAYTQTIAGAFAGTDGTTPITLRRGEGYGAADVLPSAMIPLAQVQNLLRGINNAGQQIEGRYGEGASGIAEAGVTGQVNDSLSLIKHRDFPDDYTNLPLTAFGTPPDLWGRGAFALDFLGQPLYWRQAWTGEVLNNPYRLNLAPDVVRPSTLWGTAGDNPFTPAEMEGLLRRFDADAALLARRLEKLAPILGPLRHEVTTDSYDLPVPGTNTGFANGRGKHVSELLRDKLSQNNMPPNKINAEIAKVLAWEVMVNRRMDLNRPFGNGRDSNGDSVVDEPEEAGAEAGACYPGVNAPFQVTNGSSIDSVNMARQLYARHLYILAMLLLDTDSSGNQYIQPTTAGTQDANLSATEKKELMIRRIAQWAINAATFREANSTMTCFEYDPDPFNKKGWRPDGDPSTDDGITWGGNKPRSHVVWGSVYPELVLTETLAFHDRRVADTAWDTGPRKKRTDDTNNDKQPDDPTLDQPRVPQGSAFFELYCTRNGSNSVAPADLYTYDTNTNTWYLDLARLAPPNNGTQYPVWRMAITQSRNKDSNNNVADRLQQMPDSTSLDPANFNLLAGVGGPAIPVERIVWFANLAPTGSHEDQDKIYYNHTNNNNNWLGRGGYAIVGPRAVTAVGGQDDTSTYGKPSPQYISLNPTLGVGITGGAQTYPTIGTDIQSPLAIVAASVQPNGWSQHPDGIGINISEPLFSSADYYPEPKVANTMKLPGASAPEIDAYGDLAQTDATKGYFLDQPLDSVAGRPLTDDVLLKTATTSNYKTVLLQRLANPLQPYDPVQNPYLTVDWMPIDLTVFNGEEHQPSSLPKWFTDANLQWDPDDANSNATTGVRFRARQRGHDRDSKTYPANNHNLWEQTLPQSNPDDDGLTETADSATLGGANFRHALATCTLGYVNEWYGSPWSTKSNPPAPAAYIGAPFNGTKAVPFPWLAWNNRPYATPMELLLVPTSHPGRLLWEFSMTNTTNNNNSVNLYDAANPAFELTTYWDKDKYSFGHLVNLFHSAPVGTAQSPNLFRIFDYVEVPSRFVGTETWLDPTVFGIDPGGQLYRPPFNFVSWYRDPGKININTITSPRVWAALMNGRIDSNGNIAPSFDILARSRQGYAAPVATNWWDSDARYPTRLANPFRSLSGSTMVPVIDPSGTIKLDHTRPVNSTLLRANSSTPDTSATPLFARSSTNDCDNTDRNAYFRYQDLARLSNLATTRSNMYAVWITVGYFEVEPNPNGNDLVHPDGYRLSREVGIDGLDAGQIKRHRGFYLIDRSIPAGFQRGSDLNVDKTIVLKRFIE